MTISTTANCPAGYSIRQRRRSDDAELLRIENTAGALFRDTAYPHIADDGFPDIVSIQEMMKDGETLVAVEAKDQPVGFAVCKPLGRYLHLRELAVDPAHGRKGIGRALVQKVIGVAGQRDYAGVSLTTFRNVPFNQPFYETFGFAELSPKNAPEMLRGAFLQEVPPAISPSERLLMVFTQRE